jgi:hypothetical protein
MEVSDSTSIDVMHVGCFYHELCIFFMLITHIAKGIGPQHMADNSSKFQLGGHVW